MSRGCSYGGGQSSLGYLFGADEQPSAPTETPPIQPPYGTEITPENPPLQYKPSSEKQTEKNIINNYHRAKGQNSGNFITCCKNCRIVRQRKLNQFLVEIPLWVTCLGTTDAIIPSYRYKNIAV
ncbi:protein SPIRAL1-like 5 isoform X1 [Hibiscus syriacus]|uniref:protein SPIRAL1-like 5 isoform X1 n=1 Tax=Hibiscus syriacus TaxID=106335 RepID=UPI0019250DE6|nr:protein SPIRAL1-like 5 isoform X1 [Hibiscus syriacus]